MRQPLFHYVIIALVDGDRQPATTEGGSVCVEPQHPHQPTFQYQKFKKYACSSPPTHKLHWFTAESSVTHLFGPQEVPALPLHLSIFF